MPKKKAVAAEQKASIDDRQDKFCREYLIDFNATRAAIAAGYSAKTARSQASDLLTRPNVQAHIRSISEAALQLTGDPIVRIILELQMIAFGDIKDLAEWDRWSMKWKESKDLGDKSKLIQEITETTTQFGGSRKIKLYDKLKAMEMLLRYYGVFKGDGPSGDDDDNKKVVIKIIPNGREKDVVYAEFSEIKQ